MVIRGWRTSVKKVYWSDKNERNRPGMTRGSHQCHISHEKAIHTDYLMLKLQALAKIRHSASTDRLVELHTHPQETSPNPGRR